MKKEAIDLKESKEGDMERFVGGGKKRGKGFNYIVISKIKVSKIKFELEFKFIINF